MLRNIFRERQGDQICAPALYIDYRLVPISDGEQLNLTLQNACYSWLERIQKPFPDLAAELLNDITKWAKRTTIKLSSGGGSAEGKFEDKDDETSESTQFQPALLWYEKAVTNLKTCLPLLNPAIVIDEVGAALACPRYATSLSIRGSDAWPDSVRRPMR